MRRMYRRRSETSDRLSLRVRLSLRSPSLLRLQSRPESASRSCIQLSRTQDVCARTFLSLPDMRCFLPPLECCLGTNPSHAANCLLLLNSVAFPTVATMALAVIGPTPGMASSLWLASLSLCQSLICNSNSFTCRSQNLNGHRISFRNPVLLFIIVLSGDCVDSVKID